MAKKSQVVEGSTLISWEFLRELLEVSSLLSKELVGHSIERSKAKKTLRGGSTVLGKILVLPQL